MKKTFKSSWRVSIPFLIMVPLLGIGVWNAWYAENRVVSSIAERSIEKERVSQLEALLSALKDMETGQRGYIITGEKRYLEPYNDGAVKLELTRKELEPWLKNDARFLETWTEIDGLILEKKVELARALNSRRDEGFAAAQATVIQERGQVLMKEVRAGVGSILKTMEIQAIKSDERTRQYVKKSTWATTLLSGTAIAMSLAGIFILLSAMKTRAEAQEMELEKRQAIRADREKSNFLASMSHEIRTPLNAMLGFGELLGDEVESERGKKYLHAIRTSGDGLANLINDILDLSKIESGVLELELEPVVIGDFASELELMFSQKAIEAGVDLKFHVASDCPDFLVIDALRIRQILTNLLGNAFKFTDAGEVCVNFKSHSIPDREDAVTFAVDVSDTGRGIPKEKLKQIFKPFRQVEMEDEARGGTGLGLSICRRLAGLMNGSVTVKSEWGEGSTFTLSLNEVPIATKVSDSEIDESIAGDLNVFEPSKILVVDDNPFNRDLVAGYLHGTEHTIMFATNGKEGVDQAQRIKPDVVLMDIRMPVMNGKEAFKVLKSIEDPDIENIPILAVTASSLIQEERKLRKEFDGYLRKPFSRKQLVGALKKVLPKRSKLKKGSTASATEPDAKSQASSHDTSEWPEVIDALSEWEGSRIKELQGSMALGEVASFAKELVELADAKKCEPLQEYATGLRSHASNFEMSATETKLTRFPELIQQLKSILDSPA